MQKKAALPLRDTKSGNANKMKALRGKEALVKLLRWHFSEAFVLFSQGDYIKKGQVIGYLDMFGTSLPIKSDVFGEVFKLLF
ncbi:Biotin carboxyl carrier protein of acetyl-CoA carboxylase, putative [Arachis hypogaea]|nr:Biotin carboxyl carrier protein of acetyl-CoA carboxylase, putative [Arachis hypogaea]